mmetsp:Transcript_27390/g.89650  ORF Transcript_27390/g.89650 Transcript_27390/m.89650 type:complete len:322 (-) Transcript_27390:1229-2194(-)
MSLMRAERVARRERMLATSLAVLSMWRWMAATVSLVRPSASSRTKLASGGPSSRLPPAPLTPTSGGTSTPPPPPATPPLSLLPPPLRMMMLPRLPAPVIGRFGKVGFGALLEETLTWSAKLKTPTRRRRKFSLPGERSPSPSAPCVSSGATLCPSCTSFHALLNERSASFAIALHAEVRSIRRTVGNRAATSSRSPLCRAKRSVNVIARAVYVASPSPARISSPNTLPEVKTRPFPPTTPRSTMYIFVASSPCFMISSLCGKVSLPSVNAISVTKSWGAPRKKGTLPIHVPHCCIATSPRSAGLMRLSSMCQSSTLVLRLR